MTPDQAPLRTSRPQPPHASALLLGMVLALTPTRASAFELSAGVDVGGVLAGTVPRLALNPHVGLSWRTNGGFLFAAHDVLSILPPIGGNGAGFDNRISAAVGYATENSSFSVGPSLSTYYVPVCKGSLCGRVIGVAPGAQAQAQVYFAGPLGVSVSASVGWVSGMSLSLPAGVGAMLLAGPVLRWSSK